MEELEIVDAFGDVLFISKLITPFAHIPHICNCANVIVIDKSKSTKSKQIQINKDQALQIIAHLKQCFNI
jgi:hypothetical protein